MKRKLFGFGGALVILLAPGLILTGCDTGSTPDNEKNDQTIYYGTWTWAR